MASIIAQKFSKGVSSCRLCVESGLTATAPIVLRPTDLIPHVAWCAEWDGLLNVY